MRSLFDYDDYRDFLADYFLAQKARRSSFSYRAFATKAGFRSSGFCHQVIKGARSLTPDSCARMLQGLGLKGKDAEYFCALVEYNQAKDEKTRLKAQERLDVLRNGQGFVQLQRRHYQYFAHWWNPVLRNLVTIADWHDDYALLASMVEPGITEHQAREGVALLQDLGLLERDKSGQWKQVHSMLGSDGIPAYVKRNSRKDFFELGLRSLDHFTPDERHATYFSLGLNEDGYQQIVQWIHELNLKSSALAAASPKSGRVYELTVLCFPLSRKPL